MNTGRSNNAQFGNWNGAYSPVPMRGTIISVNPTSGTCVIKTEFGNFLPNVALPNLAQDPSGGGGTLDIPRRGQEVLVQLGVSHPFIVQFCPSSVDVGLDTKDSFRLTEIELTSTLPNNSAASFSGKMPTDGQPGDWAKIGNQGQRVGVLDGGVCVIGSSPWAQVYTIASPEKDMTRITGRHMQLYSQFGTLEFGEDGGKTWMKLEGGTDQLSESTVDPSNTTFRMLVGGESNGMFSLQAFDREGSSIHEHTVHYDGAENSYVRGGQTRVTEGAVTQDIGLGRATQILNGDDSLVLNNGDRLEDYGGNYETDISGRRSVNVGGNFTVTSSRDIALVASRHMKLSTGGSLTAVKGDVAAQWNVTNGSLAIEIGNPLALDNQISMSSLLVDVMGGGDIKLKAWRPPSKIVLGSFGPGSVLLGVDPITEFSIFHAVKWEPLLVVLQAMALAIDTHIHTVFGAIPTTPSPTPVTPVLTPLFQLCQSLTVKLGPL